MRTGRFLTAAMVLVFAACSDSGSDSDGAGSVEPSHVELLMQLPLELDRGRALYEGSCANFCHGVENPDAVVNLFDCSWRHGSSDEELIAVIKTGIPGTRMVGYGDNFPEGDDDLWRIIAFLRSRQPDCS